MLDTGQPPHPPAKGGWIDVVKPTDAVIPPWNRETSILHCIHDAIGDHVVDCHHRSYLWSFSNTTLGKYIPSFMLNIDGIQFCERRNFTCEQCKFCTPPCLFDLSFQPFIAPNTSTVLTVKTGTKIGDFFYAPPNPGDGGQPEPPLHCSYSHQPYPNQAHSVYLQLLPQGR